MQQLGPRDSADVQSKHRLSINETTYNSSYMNRLQFIKFTSLGAVALAGGGAAFRFLFDEESPGIGEDTSDAAPTKRFVCTGDSWTSGNQDRTGTTYPALLAAALPWADIVNDGRAGWTSTEIAARWGTPFTLGPFTVASDPTVEVPVAITAPTAAYRTSTNIKYAWVGELRLVDGTVIPGTLRHVASSATWSDGWSFQRTQPGQSIPASMPSAFTCTEMDAHGDNALIISFGRNNFDNPAIVVRDVSAIIGARATTAPFAVLAVPTTADQPAGSIPYAQILATNTALQSAFPENYVETRRYMIDRGLAVNALVPESSDLDALSADTIPPALMISDGDHPNAAGYRAISACVIEALARSGILAEPSLGVPGVIYTAMGAMIWSADDISEPLGAQVRQILDRCGYARFDAANPSAAPVLYRDTTENRQYLAFDGTDDRMIGGPNGDTGQPFTILARIRFRNLAEVGQGVLWSYGTPGATLSVTTSGRVVLNAGSAVQTPAEAVAERTVTTIVGTANYGDSAVGATGSAIVNGEGGTRGLVTQSQIGYYFDSKARHASIDLFELRFYPWALHQEHIASISEQMA